jgi:hypothetical protein
MRGGWEKRHVSRKADAFDYSSEEAPDAALFVSADEPLLVFPSTTAAEQYLEAIDVENGVYPAAYGPHGEPYRVRTLARQVVIEPTGEPEKPEELRSLLLSYLAGRGFAADATASLEALVAQVWKVESDFWQDHDPFGDRFGTRIPLWGCLTFTLAVAAVLYLVVRFAG